MVLILLAPTALLAQENYAQHWNGVWVADGTLFKIQVEVTGTHMEVTRIETLGFEWTHTLNPVQGNTVTVEVQYAGVSGVLQAELLGPDRARVFPLSCAPEFMVVCALAKDRQAIFIKVED